jgi:hypothetical protein
VSVGTMSFKLDISSTHLAPVTREDPCVLTFKFDTPVVATVADWWTHGHEHAGDRHGDDGVSPRHCECRAGVVGVVAVAKSSQISICYLYTACTHVCGYCHL